MFARVATFEGVDVAKVKQASDATHDWLGPVYATLPGWLGAMTLADPTTGKVIAISIFDTEEHAKGGEETFEKDMPNALGEIMETWKGKRVSVDQCEIVLQLPR